MPSPYLQLLRPANVVTAAADVVAGFAIAGAPDLALLPWLVSASACLYGGGVVLNDVFDRHLDAIERPDRPIPSGRLSASRASWLGAGLLAAGVLAASGAGFTAGIVAATLAASVVLYDALAKRNRVAGPAVMGACRGLNFGLGLAASPAALRAFWPLSLLAVFYIAGITIISRGEVSGGRKPMAAASVALVACVTTALALLAGQHGDRAPLALALTALLGWRVLPPLWHAYRTLEASAIRQAVKRGVLSLVLLDAALTAAYAGTGYAAAVLITGLLAGYLARFFAVT